MAQGSRAEGELDGEADKGHDEDAGGPEADEPEKLAGQGAIGHQW